MRRCPTKRKAVIFGSGMLYDVPLSELATTFARVVLVDVVHPLGAGWNLGNVTALAADVTGTAATVYRLARRGGERLPRFAPHAFCDDPEVDLAASVNLLSPAAVHPVQVPLRRRHLQGGRNHRLRPRCGAGARRLPEAAAGRGGARLRPGAADGGPHGGGGRAAERLRGVKLPWSGEEWVWDLAPRPEASPIYSYRRRVVGIPNVKNRRLLLPILSAGSRDFVFDPCRLAQHRDGTPWAEEFAQLPALEQVTKDGGNGLAKGLEQVNARR